MRKSSIFSDNRASFTFWNDTDGARCLGPCFARFPGIRCHGDYAEIVEHGGTVIYGRSDAVLNPGGVRIGPAESYGEIGPTLGEAANVN